VGPSLLHGGGNFGTIWLAHQRLRTAATLKEAALLDEELIEI
jgi:hypothetical protein